MSSATILLAILAFETKHFLCDFVLQTGYLARTKKIYGHWGGFAHAGLHALTSIPALLVLAVAWPLIAAVVAFEFVFHYHVDWAKGFIDTRMGWTEANAAYWMLFGTDQFVHQLTYIGFVALLAHVIVI